MFFSSLRSCGEAPCTRNARPGWPGGLARLPSSRWHDLCCYGSLLVMSPQVMAAIIAAGVGLLAVAVQGGSACRATSWDTQKAARSAG